MSSILGRHRLAVCCVGAAGCRDGRSRAQPRRRTLAGEPRTRRRRDRPARSALAAHPLAPAWAWRARLDAVRRQAAVDGKAIDPWHLAALIEGVRFRLDQVPRRCSSAACCSPRPVMRSSSTGGLPRPTRRSSRRSPRRQTISTRPPTRSRRCSAPPLAVHAWLDQGGERPPLRAALAHVLAAARGDPPALPAVDRSQGVAGRGAVGARRLDRAFPRRPRRGGRGRDRAASPRSSATGLPRARAVAGRRRDSRAAAAIDILAAAPLVSATSLGQALGMATNNATRLLEGFVGLGIASEVTHRSKRRLYGLKHLAPLREAAAPPRRPLPGRRPGRPSAAVPRRRASQQREPRGRDATAGPLPSPAPARAPRIRVWRTRPLARSRRPGDPPRAAGSRTA